MVVAIFNILKFDFDHLNIFIGKDWLDSLFRDRHLHFILNIYCL